MKIGQSRFSQTQTTSRFGDVVSLINEVLPVCLLNNYSINNGRKKTIHTCLTLMWYNTVIVCDAVWLVCCCPWENEGCRLNWTTNTRSQGAIACFDGRGGTSFNNTVLHPVMCWDIISFISDRSEPAAVYSSAPVIAGSWTRSVPRWSGLQLPVKGAALSASSH